VHSLGDVSVERRGAYHHLWGARAPPPRR